MIGSYLPFIVYASVFICLFVVAALFIKMDVTKTFDAELITEDGNSYIVIHSKIDDRFSHFYTYINKNEQFYKVEKKAFRYDGNSTYLQLDNSQALEDFSSRPDRTIKTDIPQGQTSLLKRMFPIGETGK